MAPRLTARKPNAPHAARMGAPRARPTVRCRWSALPSARATMVGLPSCARSVVRHVRALEQRGIRLRHNKPGVTGRKPQKRRCRRGPLPTGFLPHRRQRAFVLVRAPVGPPLARVRVRVRATRSAQWMGRPRVAAHTPMPLRPRARVRATVLYRSGGWTTQCRAMEQGRQPGRQGVASRRLCGAQVICRDDANARGSESYGSPDRRQQRWPQDGFAPRLCQRGALRRARVRPYTPRALSLSFSALEQDDPGRHEPAWSFPRPPESDPTADGLGVDVWDFRPISLA
jgi:hypothetical protein